MKTERMRTSWKQWKEKTASAETEVEKGSSVDIKIAMISPNRVCRANFHTLQLREGHICHSESAPTSALKHVSAQ